MLALLTAFFVACGESGPTALDAGDSAPPPPSGSQVASVEVTPARTAVPIGDTVRLEASLHDADGAEVEGDIRWSSGDPQVASVDGDGVVTGGARGEAVVVASASCCNVSDTSRIVVTDPNFSMPEASFDPAIHALVDREDFDGFDSFSSGTSPFLAKYPRGRAGYPGFSGNKDFLGPDTDQMEADGILSIVAGRGGSGGALKELYAGSDGASDIIAGPQRQDLESVGGLDGTLPEVAGPYEHFFFTAWFRTTPGANPAETNSSSVKGFMFWDDFPRRFEVRPMKLRYGGSRWGEPRWGPGGGYPENDFTGLNHWKTSDGFPPRWSNFNDGSWHRITIEFHGGNIPDSEKGWRMWLDGVYVFDNVGEAPEVSDLYGNGVGKDWDGNDFISGMQTPHDLPIEGFSVWGNFVNSDAAKATSQFSVSFDDWIVWTVQP